jgi:hypothetical protein
MNNNLDIVWANSDSQHMYIKVYKKSPKYLK